MPSSLSTYGSLSSTSNGSIFCGYLSTISEEICPPAYSLMSRAARLIAQIVELGSTPRSKRYEESVLIPWRLADLRTQVGLKNALSRKMSFVSGVTPEFSPPIIPASTNGLPSPSQIIRSFSSRVISVSLRVMNFVPGLTVFTRIFPPVMVSASKPWSGWPISCWT